MARRRRDRSRGRHKRASSPETARWEDAHLIVGRPSWMREDDYRALLRLRRQLDPLGSP